MHYPVQCQSAITSYTQTLNHFVHYTVQCQSAITSQNCTREHFVMHWKTNNINPNLGGASFEVGIMASNVKKCLETDPLLIDHINR